MWIEKIQLKRQNKIYGGTKTFQIFDNNEKNILLFVYCAGQKKNDRNHSDQRIDHIFVEDHLVIVSFLVLMVFITHLEFSILFTSTTISIHGIHGFQKFYQKDLSYLCTVFTQYLLNFSYHFCSLLELFLPACQLPQSEKATKLFNQP